MQRRPCHAETSSPPAVPPAVLGRRALGAAAFLLVFGPSPLDVTNDAFCRGGFIEKDIQQHYAGWLFYRQSALRFPLCIAESVNWPDGLSVAYTDSIPLPAAFFRLLSPLLPETFQYFGWFTLVCFFLQGAFGARLLGLFAKGCALPLLGDLLRQPFPSAPRSTSGCFCHGTGDIHGTFLLSRCFLILPLPAFLRDKPPGAFAGAQPDGVHRGARQARFVRCVDGLTGGFLFWLFHAIIAPFTNWQSIV